MSGDSGLVNVGNRWYREKWMDVLCILNIEVIGLVDGTYVECKKKGRI